MRVLDSNSLTAYRYRVRMLNREVVSMPTHTFALISPSNWPTPLQSRVRSSRTGTSNPHRTNLEVAQEERPLSGPELIKEVCRRIRVARSYWDVHNNAAAKNAIAP